MTSDNSVIKIREQIVVGNKGEVKAGAAPEPCTMFIFGKDRSRLDGLLPGEEAKKERCNSGGVYQRCS